MNSLSHGRRNSASRSRRSSYSGDSSAKLNSAKSKPDFGNLPSFRILTADKKTTESPALVEARLQEHAANNDFDLELNIAVVGDEGVGKSALLRVAVKGQLLADQVTYDRSASDQVGIDIYTKFYFDNLMIARSSDDWKSQSYVVKVNYWDCTGREEHVEETCRLASKCCGVVYVYDVNNARTFHDLHQWVSMVENDSKQRAAQQQQQQHQHVPRMLKHRRREPSLLHRQISILRIPDLAERLKKVKTHKTFVMQRQKILFGTKGESDPKVKTADIRRMCKDYDMESFTGNATTGNSILHALSSLRKDILDMVTQLQYNELGLARAKLYPGVVLGSKLFENINRLPATWKPQYQLSASEKTERGITDTMDWL